MPQLFVRSSLVWITAYDLYPTYGLDESLGPRSYFPVATGNLFCSNDAGVARRQTASIRSLAVSASRIRFASHRRDPAQMLAKTPRIAPGRAHLFLLQKNHLSTATRDALIQINAVEVRASATLASPSRCGTNVGSVSATTGVCVRSNRSIRAPDQPRLGTSRIDLNQVDKLIAR
jgi:hypothetical protein